MLINLRNALMAGKRLPYDAEVAYLEGTGSQWIDTGVDASLCNSAIMKIECAFSVIGRGGPGGNYNGIFGAAVPRFGVYTITNNLSWGYGQAHDNIKTFTYGDWIESTCVFTKGNQTATFDGSSFTATNGSTLSSLTIGVFCRNNTPVQWLALAKIRYLRIYVNSVFVRDYIPVRKGSVGYLYDRVSGKLFGNAGTGDFVLGPDVVPVEYIESHGTEWIDTGVKSGPSNIDFTVDCSIDSRAGSYSQCGSGVNTTGGLHYVLDQYGIRTGGGNASLAIPYTLGTRVKIRAYYNANNERTVQVGSEVYQGSAYNAGQANLNILKLNNTASLQVGKLWGATVSQSGDFVRKFLPVRVGTEGAMMDVLTRRIYRNAGTGAFSYGNDLKYPIPAA